MTSLGSAVVDVRADTSRMQKDVEGGLGSAFKKAAAIASVAFAGIGITNFVGDSIKQASDLGESVNAINVVLGSGAESFLKFGETAATQLGITQSALNSALIPAAAAFKNAGVGGEALSKNLQGLAMRATDVGSIFNADVNEVLLAFNAALRGEAEPARRFGVDLNAAAIGAKAVALGLSESATELSASAKTQAAYALLLEQTNLAQGDFLNTADGVANASKIIKASFDELKAEVGVGLLPAIKSILGAVVPLIDTVTPLFTSLGETIGAAISSVIPALMPLFSSLTLALETLAPSLPILATSFAELLVAVAPLLPIMAELAVAVLPTFALLVTGLAAVLTPLLATIQGLVEPLNGVGRGSQIAGYGLGVVMVGALVALKAALIQAKIQAAAFWIASFGPVGIAVAALAALALAFKTAWDHSETFRNIVVGALNKVKDIALSGIALMVNAYEFWVTGILIGFRTILQGLGKIPDWLGGGKFDDAAAGVQRMIDGVHAIGDSIDGLINQVKAADIVLSGLGTGPTGMTGQEMLDSLSAQNDAYKKTRAAAELAARPFPTQQLVPSVGISSLGSGSAAATKAETAAKAAATKLKAAMKAVRDSLGEIGKRTGKQTADDLRREFDALADGLKGADAKLYLSNVREVEERLLRLSKTRDRLNKQLSEAKGDLSELRKEARGFSDAIRSSVTELGNVSKANEGIAVTFEGIRRNLADAIGTTSRFSTAIKGLTRAGLNETSLRQLIAAGPEAGLAAAEALLGAGQAAITGPGGINDLQKTLDKAGKSLATSTTDTLYAAGISAGKGLVEGLRSQEDKIVAQMDRIADRLVSSIKKKLEIRSPSGVLSREVGAELPAGIAEGVRNNAGVVERAMMKLSAQAVAFGPGSVQVNGVSDPEAARRAGLLAGYAINDVLDKRAAAAALAGVG